TYLIENKIVNLKNIQSPKYQKEYLLYKQNLHDLQTRFQKVKQDFERNTLLYKKEVIAKVEFENTKLDCDLAVGNMNQLQQQQLNTWQANLTEYQNALLEFESNSLQLQDNKSQFVVTAPINGVLINTMSLENGSFSNSDKINLVSLEIEKPNILDEVMLFSKSNKKYIKFTAYFRNIQFNNFQPQYYMDGIVEYYIANKNGKAKICVLQNRSLKNTTIKQLDEKGLVRFSFNMTGVPNLEDFIDFEKLKKEYQIDKLDTSYSFIEDGIEIGKIEEEKDNLVLNLQIYSIEKPKIMKLFGIESVLKGYTVNTIYNKTEDPNILQDLLYFKEYREYDIKQKKDKNYTYINCINEVFIIDR